jgi:uncharacterized protein YjlB
LKLTRIDRIIVFILTRIKRIRAVMDMAVGTAYDQGYKAGMYQGAKTHGKKYANKVKKAMDSAYNKKNTIINTKV